MHDLRVKPGDVMLVPGDLHFGICDLPSFNLMMEAASALKITHAVLQGDTFECAGLSSHAKSAARLVEGGLLLSKEIDQASQPLHDLLRLCKGRGVAMPGNHEERINRFVDESPAWHGMRWHDVFAPALKGWTCLESGDAVKAGRVSIFHGHTLAGMRMGGGVTPAKTVLTQYPGQHTIFGHTHRRDCYTRPTWKDQRKVAHGAWNVGHMQDERHAGWAGDQAWEQSFAIVHFHDGDLFDVSLARYVRDRRNRASVLIAGRVFR